MKQEADALSKLQGSPGIIKVLAYVVDDQEVSVRAAHGMACVHCLLGEVTAALMPRPPCFHAASFTPCWNAHGGDGGRRKQCAHAVRLRALGWEGGFRVEHLG